MEKLFKLFRLLTDRTHSYSLYWNTCRIVGLLWIIKHRNATNEFGYFIQGTKS